jgi:hypothetical protein
MGAEVGRCGLVDGEMGEGRTLQPDGLEGTQWVAAFHPEVRSHILMILSTESGPSLPMPGQIFLSQSVSATNRQWSYHI